jgi:hypothetical protein
VLRERGSDPAISRIPVIVSTSLAVTPELTSQLPAGIPVLSKHALSRESVSMMLRNTLPSRGRS